MPPLQAAEGFRRLAVARNLPRQANFLLAQYGFQSRGTMLACSQSEAVMVNFQCHSLRPPAASVALTRCLNRLATATMVRFRMCGRNCANANVAARLVALCPMCLRQSSPSAVLAWHLIRSTACPVRAMGPSAADMPLGPSVVWEVQTRSCR